MLRRYRVPQGLFIRFSPALRTGPHSSLPNAHSFTFRRRQPEHLQLQPVYSTEAPCRLSFALSLVIESSPSANTPPSYSQPTGSAPAHPGALDEQPPFILFVANLVPYARIIIDPAFRLNCNSKFTLFQGSCVERSLYQPGMYAISGSRL